jgi:hypothetical protein
VGLFTLARENVAFRDDIRKLWKSAHRHLLKIDRVSGPLVHPDEMLNSRYERETHQLCCCPGWECILLECRHCRVSREKQRPANIRFLVDDSTGDFYFLEMK